MKDIQRDYRHWIKGGEMNCKQCEYSRPNDETDWFCKKIMDWLPYAKKELVPASCPLINWDEAKKCE